MAELHARVETHLKLRRLGVALDESNARLGGSNAQLERANGRMSRDLKAAAKTQRAFLPRGAPDVPGMVFAWTTGPATSWAATA